MLQQTTVGAVRPRYAAFLSRFPDVAALARARPETVLAAWSGLGYYARARNLHAAARAIVRDHSGHLPPDPAALRGLPGFGEYMAAAVASLAFGARLPAVDANVARVLSRLFAIEGVVGTRAHTDRVRLRAAALLTPARPGDVTAALMDLGQLICTPRHPRCDGCPLAAECAALARGAVARFPRKKPRPRITRVFVAAAAAQDAGRILLVRSTQALMRGLWLFPSAHGDSPDRALSLLRTEARGLGLRIAARAPIGRTLHTIVHRLLTIAVYPAVRVPRRAPRDSPVVRWLTPAQFGAAAIPTLTRRICAAAGFPTPSLRRTLERHADRAAPAPRHGAR
ncbi:MAG TPA: NUDIX domain-containing protein [Vicinamibacteria bacterium]|nr:NUDIX domain-containing protein [Vicinamibacteria bacterium]